MKDGKQLAASSDWHLSPSQVKELESKIKEYVHGSNKAGLDTDEDEVFENFVIGTLDNEIGEISASKGQDDD